ncbi:hypothetical protein ACFL6I_07025 [candidate division KSB1 bacterium]
MNNKIANWINLALFIITLILNLTIKLHPPVWTGYGDPYDYINQSKESLLSKNFYFTKKNDLYNARPFTVPLIYKIANGDPDFIIALQKVLHGLAAFFLCFVILLFLRKTYAKLVFIIFWYLLMSWWNILGWTNTLLAESLINTFMFLWIASFLLLLHKRTFINFSIHIILTLLFSFTRDSWPYILIIFYAIVTLTAIKLEKKILLSSVCLLLFSISVFFIQQKSAQIGQRYRIPIMNNIVFRILPNEENLNWFSQKGMPCIDKLKEKYSNLRDWKMIYPLYNDTSLTEFSNWIIKEGKPVYTKFLISHPANLFLLNEKAENKSKIFAYNIGYAGSVKGYSYGSQYIFPLFNTVFILLLNCFLIFIYFKEKRFVLILPTILIIIFTLNAILLFIADVLEVERHLIVTNIIIQFIGILLVSLLIDSDLINGYMKRILKKS